jgi:hypothetical protein
VLLRRGRIVGRLRVARRDVLPHAKGIASAVYRRRLSGPVTVAVEVLSPERSVRALRRTFRLSP